MNGIKMVRDKPKITIVTVTYNAEKYLEQTIKSVISQDYPNIEYIIIDGASTDGTIDIIKKYEKYIDYWISEHDSGIYDAMNKGIDVATGEWINFMNAGDIFSSQDILGEIATNLSDKIDVLYGGVNLLDKNFNIYGYSAPKKMDTIWENSYCNHQTLFVKTDVMQRYKFNLTYKMASDRDLMMNLFLNGHEYLMLELPIANFMVIDESASVQNTILDSIESLHIIAKNTKQQNIIYNHTHYHKLKLNDLKEKTDKSYQLRNIVNKFNEIYTFLEHIAKENRTIVLYGYGTFGKLIEHIFASNNLIIIDKNANKLQKDNIYNIEYLKYIDFDKIIITALGHEDGIKESLMIDYEIADEKLVTLDII